MTPAPPSTRPPAAPAPPSGGRIGRRQLQAITNSLSTRDHELLSYLAVHRFATTNQLARLTTRHYRTPASTLRQTSRHLRRLTALGLTTHLKQRIGGVRGGSSGLIWYLRPPGWRLTTPPTTNSLNHLDPPVRRRLTEPSPTFLAHTLAITEARVIIHEAARASSGHLTLIRTEPACWRSWTLVSGTRRWLKPDLEAVTTTPDGDEDHWLLEIDLGTENPARLLTKSHNYQDHLATGLEQATTGGYYPQVVWTMSSTNRATQLCQAITNDPGLSNELFCVITVGELPELIQRGAGK